MRIPNEQTNLLPPGRRRAFRRDYFTRLGVIAAFLATALTLAAALLLVPAYVFLAKSTAAEEMRLANLESAVSSSDEAALSARLDALSNNAVTLSALAHVNSPSSVLQEFLSIPRPGITLSGLAYSAAAGQSPETLVISGNAQTRDALRAYQLALQGAPRVSAADLPVSAYAQDTNIAFTITVTLAP